MNRVISGLLVTAALLSGCGGGGGGGGPPDTQIVSPALGDPLPGISADELAAFQRGKLIFEKRFKPSEGLGPFYNATSCSSCHSTPVTGGSSRLYRNFYLARYGNPQLAGGQANLPSLPSPVVPAFSSNLPHPLATFSLERGRFVIPHGGVGPVPVQVAQRNGIPIFGVGLFEFVNDATILANADPNDTDADGISGRYNTDQGAIGRFGVKAQSNNIELFTRAPLQNQMGITTNPFLGSGGLVGKTTYDRSPRQASSNPNDPTVDADGVQDPELGHDDLGDLIAFTRFLAPPEPIPFDAAATHGQELFTSIGCAKCHVPMLMSSRGPVNAYTDLLLHDMGDDLADDMVFGVPQASVLAGPTPYREFRTQPLWGVSLTKPFLHDGRAETLLEAITLHAGEAQAIRDAFLALSGADQADVIAFLEHL